MNAVAGEECRHGIDQAPGVHRFRQVDLKTGGATGWPRPLSR